MGDWEPLPDDPIWVLLRNRVVALMDGVGSRCDYPGFQGDWYLLDEDTGQQMVKIELVNNELLRPSLIKSLQALLVGYPDWAIAFQVAGTDADGNSRGMGLWIEADKISDELKREYLPSIFRNMTF